LQHQLKVFKDYGIDLSALTVDEAADRIRNTAVGLELAAWSDLFAQELRELNDPLWSKVNEIARRVDADPWRCRMRDTLPLEPDDRRDALRNLAASVHDEGLDPH